MDSTTLQAQPGLLAVGVWRHLVDVFGIARAPSQWPVLADSPGRPQPPGPQAQGPTVPSAPSTHSTQGPPGPTFCSSVQHRTLGAVLAGCVGREPGLLPQSCPSRPLTHPRLCSGARPHTLPDAGSQIPHPCTQTLWASGLSYWGGSLGPGPWSCWKVPAGATVPTPLGGDHPSGSESRTPRLNCPQRGTPFTRNVGATWLSSAGPGELEIDFLPGGPSQKPRNDGPLPKPG